MTVVSLLCLTFAVQVRTIRVQHRQDLYLPHQHSYLSPIHLSVYLGINSIFSWCTLPEIDLLELYVRPLSVKNGQERLFV